MLGDMTTASQRTLKTMIGCRGVGLHSGQKVTMRLLPAAPDTGIVFRRTDAGAEILANWVNTIESPRCTVLSNGEGITVGTVEHLMAALAGAEIDNAIIELDGPEVPIMDGSSAPFLFLIECAGLVEQDAARRAIKVLKPVSVIEEGATAALLPDHGFSMSFEISFANPLISRQDICVEVDRLREAGFGRGGSLDNVIVVSGDHILNAGGLRYADEFVRHKLLDAFGDLYLAGGPIIGRFRGVCSGHAHTRHLLAALFADTEAWRYTSQGRATDFGALDRPGEMHLSGV